MWAHTIEGYQNSLEIGLKQQVTTQKILQNPLMHSITLEEIDAAPSILACLTAKGMSQALMSHFLLVACHALITQYANEISSRLFFFKKTHGHSALAETIKNKLNIKAFLSGEEGAQQATVDRLILMLESGMFSQELNPVGTYAKLCSAIINKSSHIGHL